MADRKQPNPLPPGVVRPVPPPAPPSVKDPFVEQIIQALAGKDWDLVSSHSVRGAALLIVRCDKTGQAYQVKLGLRQRTFLCPGGCGETICL